MLKTRRQLITDVGAALPAAAANGRGMLGLERDSGAEDQLYVNVQNSSGNPVWRPVLTGTTGFTVYNVLQYGATGDGTTDDSTAINAAIAAAATAGGGIVYLPEGVYICTVVEIRSYVWLMGAGPRASILRAKPSTNAAVIVTYNSAALWGSNSTGGEHDFRISNLAVDGNKANIVTGGSNSYGIRLYGYGWTMENVRIYECDHVGLESEWSDSAGSPGTDSMEAHVTDVKVHDCENHGIYWHGPHDSVWEGIISYSNGEDTAASTANFHIAPNGNALIAKGCHAWGATTDRAWNIDGSGCHLIGCTGEGSATEQVLITRNDVCIIGGAFFAAGGGAIGIHLNTVAGCQIHTHVLNCTSGAIKFTADSGSHMIDILSYQTSGAVVNGTPSSGNEMRIVVNGGGTGSVVRHQGTTTITGSLDHDGTTVGFFGVTPAVRPSAYTATNVTTDRSYDADTVLVAELADVVGTLIADLRTLGIVQ